MQGKSLIRLAAQKCLGTRRHSLKWVSHAPSDKHSPFGAGESLGVALWGPSNVGLRRAAWMPSSGGLDRRAESSRLNESWRLYSVYHKIKLRYMLSLNKNTRYYIDISKNKNLHSLNQKYKYERKINTSLYKIMLNRLTRR